MIRVQYCNIEPDNDLLQERIDSVVAKLKDETNPFFTKKLRTAISNAVWPSRVVLQ